jgi:transcription elongation factor Elf1
MFNHELHKSLSHILDSLESQLRELEKSGKLSEYESVFDTYEEKRSSLKVRIDETNAGIAKSLGLES